MFVRGTGLYLANILLFFFAHRSIESDFIGRSRGRNALPSIFRSAENDIRNRFILWESKANPPPRIVLPHHQAHTYAICIRGATRLPALFSQRRFGGRVHDVLNVLLFD